MIPTLSPCHVTKRGLSTDPFPPLLVHVVIIECPLSVRTPVTNTVKQWAMG